MSLELDRRTMYRVGGGREARVAPAGSPRAAADARRILAELIRERQKLVGLRAGDVAMLEANRLAIAYWHRRLHGRTFGNPPAKDAAQ